MHNSRSKGHEDFNLLVRKSPRKWYFMPTERVSTKEHIPIFVLDLPLWYYVSSLTLSCKTLVLFKQTSEMVMWKKKPHDEMLFFMETRHTSDKYYSLDRSYNDWNLVITTILERHEGVYICCQIVRGTEITIREYTLFVNGTSYISALFKFP